MVKKCISLLHLFSLVITRYLYIYTKSVTIFPYEMKSYFIKKFELWNNDVIFLLFSLIRIFGIYMLNLRTYRYSIIKRGD